MKKRSDDAGLTPLERLVSQVRDLETATANILEMACAGQRPTIRVLAWLSRVSSDVETAYRVLDSNYGDWQGETGSNRPEEEQAQEEAQ